MEKKRTAVFWLISFVLFGLFACSAQPADPAAQDLTTGEKPQVVATTTIVGDVVSRVGGDLIDLSVLLPADTDPHSFDPTPQDIAKIAGADLVFANGGGLEGFLDNLIASAGEQAQVVYVSDGIDLLAVEDGEHERDNKGGDPHTWTDPNNVIVWAEAIERELSLLDPENGDSYRENAENYKIELEALDAWIREQVARIPVENRKLVTDHTIFGYFANAYSFDQIGTLIPGYSTLAEPTAKELSEIEDAVRAFDVQAVFVGNTVNPALAQRVAEDTGTRLVFVYSGSLSEYGGEASTYFEYMRYNTTAIVEALIPDR